MNLVFRRMIKVSAHELHEVHVITSVITMSIKATDLYITRTDISGA